LILVLDVVCTQQRTHVIQRSNAQDDMGSLSEKDNTLIGEGTTSEAFSNSVVMALKLQSSKDKRCSNSEVVSKTFLNHLEIRVDFKKLFHEWAR
jgi:hypothetical protein